MNSFLSFRVVSLASSAAPRIIAVSMGIAMCAPALGQTTLIRVAQAYVPGDQVGSATFDANVMGVIKPWQTSLTAQQFYAYGSPNSQSFNGPVPLTNERIHLFFVQASDGLAAYGVYDKPGNADGGSIQADRWVRPAAAEVQVLNGIDAEDPTFTCEDGRPVNNRTFRHLAQRWGTCCTDGWIIRLDDSTTTRWTSFRFALHAGYGDCPDRQLLSSGLATIAAISPEGTSAVARLLRPNQEAVQFRAVSPCELTAWPSQQSQCVGATASFSARPNGSGPVTFVWKKDGVVLSPSLRVSFPPRDGGLEGTLVIGDVGSADVGAYTCDVTSSCGTQTSTALTLAVTSGTPSSTNPAPLAPVRCGGAATFAVIASGSGPFTYQWRRGGVPLHDVGYTSGTESSRISISAVALTDSGAYDCIVSNACGSTTTSTAALAVIACRCSVDFNGDGDIGTDQDIEAFFRCLSGTCCPTCPSNADFNGDGDVGTDADIESFFRVLAGGSC